MSERVLQLNKLLTTEDELAVQISQSWNTWRNQMANKRAEWQELDAYIFATDTTTTTSGSLPWKNSTTLPKICQIRDNLHSNYMAALFPNDKWLTWVAHTKDAAKHDISRGLTGYMANKTREGGFKTTVSRLVYDYIDKGNCFSMPSFERRYIEKNGEKVADFVGPKAVRISPYDIVFDPTASDFVRTPKIVRSIKKLADLRKLMEIDEASGYWQEVLDRRMETINAMSGLKADDWEKVTQYEIDGFGSLQEYYTSDYVEILEFYGDYYNVYTGEFQQNRMITVVDRQHVVRNIEMPTYSGRSPISHVGWRLRNDNLWAMGPLDNLIGLQYRLDHLENLKADAMDLVVHPPLKIIGEVEEFEWGPNCEIHIDEGGDVQEVSSSMQAIATTQGEMQLIEDRMELYAGAPREAMGIRTPGEKTAFEFDSLQTAAGRIFQEKANNFEVNLIEPLLNGMLEEAHKNFESIETISVIDDELGITEFLEISKDDLTAEGVLRPVGARHFAQQSQDLVNLNQLFSGPLGAKIDPHTSGVELTRLIDNVMNLRGYAIFTPNVAVLENQETQRLMQTAQEDLQVEAETPVEGEFAQPIEEDENEEELV